MKIYFLYNYSATLYDIKPKTSFANIIERYMKERLMLSASFKYKNLLISDTDTPAKLGIFPNSVIIVENVVLYKPEQDPVNYNLDVTQFNIGDIDFDDPYEYTDPYSYTDQYYNNNMDSFSNFLNMSYY